MEPTQPATIGRYEIKSEIGRGLGTVVYRGWDPQNSRPVALKLLPAGLTLDPAFEAFFIESMVSAARLQHPNILPVLDYAVDSGQPYLVTALMNSGSLKTLIASGPLSLERALALLTQLAAALDSAHTQGFIHETLHPGNIILDDGGQAYLNDFGLAGLMDSNESTRSLSVSAPVYMSPEQAVGLKAAERSDIYSLGVIAFELLAGRPPFLPGKTPVLTARAHLIEPIPNLSNFNPALPTACDKVMDSVLAKKAEERYGTAAEFVNALTTALQQIEPSDTRSKTEPGVAPSQAEPSDTPGVEPAVPPPTGLDLPAWVTPVAIAAVIILVILVLGWQLSR